MDTPTNSLWVASRVALATDLGILEKLTLRVYGWAAKADSAWTTIKQNLSFKVFFKPIECRQSESRSTVFLT